MGPGPRRCGLRRLEALHAATAAGPTAAATTNRRRLQLLRLVDTRQRRPELPTAAGTTPQIPPASRPRGNPKKRKQHHADEASSQHQEAGEGFVVADANGHLVVIEVHSLETGIVTSLGDRDAIRATVHDITAEHTYEDTLIFPKVLIGSLKSRIGQKVLGTIGQGVAKPGQNAPWVINDASGDAAAGVATAYLTTWPGTGRGSSRHPAQPVGRMAAAPGAGGPWTRTVQAALAALAAQQKGAAPF